MGPTRRAALAKGARAAVDSARAVSVKVAAAYGSADLPSWLYSSPLEREDGGESS